MSILCLTVCDRYYHARWTCPPENKNNSRMMSLQYNTIENKDQRSITKWTHIFSNHILQEGQPAPLGD